MRESKGEKLFYGINYLLLTCIACLCVYPLIYILSASLSNPMEVISGNVILLPRQITLETYRRVLQNSEIWIAFANTVFYTLAGTVISMVLSILGAYSLSKKRLMGRRWISFFYFPEPVVSGGNYSGLFEHRQSAYAEYAMGDFDPVCTFDF